jgi:hypothetical protein
MYLSFPQQRGDEKALEHALAMRQRFPNLELELLYVACWAARRCRLYANGDALGREALEIAPGDARIHNALALNTYAWLTDEEQRDACSLTLADARDFAVKATELYERDVERYSLELRAASLNNLAYLCVVDATSSAYDLPAARMAIERVKVLQGDWTQQFPEYYHTDAVICLREFEALQVAEAPKTAQCERLLRARDLVTAASDVFPKTAYKKLHRRIERLIAKVGCRLSDLRAEQERFPL